MTGRRGANLIEVLIASSLTGVVLLALGGFIASAYRASGKDQDRTFALQKALQIMEELGAYKAENAVDRGIEAFADGPQFLLTTSRDAVPDDALSGNPRKNGSYKYVRRITTEPVPGDEYARKITVEIYYAARDRQPKIAPGAKPLAVVSNIVRTSTARVGPRQVLDMWVISIENLPHVMRRPDGTQFAPSASEARRYFEAALRQLETKNPWLGFRVHYVSRLAAGRDPHYRPYVNDGQALTGASRDALERVYLYPGRVGEGPDGTRYFDPRLMKAKIALGGVTGAAGATLQGELPACDQFNHAARLDEEPRVAGEEPSLRQFLEALHGSPGTTYRNGIVVNLHGELMPVVPLRNYADAARDPAEPDDAAARRRLVTHPHKLAFAVADEPVRLLVHPYMADGGETPSAGGNDRHVRLADTFPRHARAARIVVKGIRPYLRKAEPLAAGPGGIDDVSIKLVQRERTSNGNCGGCDEATYVVKTAWPATGEDETDAARKNHSGPHVRADEAHGGGADPTFVGDDLVVQLRDLDYDAREVKGGGTWYGIGADPAYKLHGLQYFPDPLLPFLTAPSGQTRPRNTARVVLDFRLGEQAARKRFEVVTQLMKPDGGFPDPTAPDPRTSRTWIHAVEATDWDPTRKLYWDLANEQPALPWTEQVQLVGDPRHNPYLDVRLRGGYNRYFSDFRAGKEVYKGITSSGASLDAWLDAANPFADGVPTAGTLIDASLPNTADAWAGTKIDLPAYFRVWREGLLRNDMVFVNASGQPMRYVGLGGEFALDRPVGGDVPVHVSRRPWEPAPGLTELQADELTGERAGWIARASGDGWYARPWIGELYPPDARESWRSTGNLPAGAFLRRRLSQLDRWPTGTDRRDENDRRALEGGFGLSAFLNALADGALKPPALVADGSRGRLTDTGQAAASALHASLTASLAADVGLRKEGGEPPPDWASVPYTPHLALEWLNKPFAPAAYYDHEAGDGAAASAPLLLKEPASGRRAIVLANTLRPDAGNQLLATMEAAAVTAVGAFFDGTRPSLGAHNVKPLPRVKIKEPATGALLTAPSVPIRWYARGVKANGKPYSSLFTYHQGLRPDQGGPLDVIYFVKFRNQTANGPWRLAKTAGMVNNAGGESFDGVPVAEGEPVVHKDARPIPNLPAYPEPVTVAWDTTGLEAGQYLLRVEAYRKVGDAIVPSHMAYHEVPVTLVR